MIKQKGSNVNESTAGSRSGKRANRKSARHGARNQHRHKHFARWILERFPHIRGDCSGADADEKSLSRPGASTPMHILDVAGGKGELSARLSLCHSLNVIMIDPRPADIASVYMNSVVPKLPNKWQSSIKGKLKLSPTFVQDKLGLRFSQLVMPFPSPSHLEMLNEADRYFQDTKLDAAVRNASILIGLHADGATEAVVDAALLYGKPFVVVPCCVFPNLFCERFISVPVNAPHGNDTGVGSVLSENAQEEENALKHVPVRTHDQFCKYLLAKDNRFVMEVLPFEGRNVAIWWDGK
eukprot:CAMPEP_0172554898 /NCGR_PEP_ID=MMETSP1067-20121228/56917_1 /TAXON_ID=265564 ORGANISM="Thalassiosira punctigera, Strain Tpunct2005C2" /NCGR_SAMPLE_ID=MMETSP1067 /ASSEMBLY_ACC=CAM_ASM_000444 /LENGTH=295 /DNA_ID=CAMNT_0013343361 /DNA_START=259 /DNA_END=1146 /DNA_ORIENTATION=+